MTARELVNRISLLDMVKQLGDRLTVGQRTLTPPVLVRIQVPQPVDPIALFSVSTQSFQNSWELVWETLFPLRAS